MFDNWSCPFSFFPCGNTLTYLSDFPCENWIAWTSARLTYHLFFGNKPAAFLFFLCHPINPSMCHGWRQAPRDRRDRLPEVPQKASPGWALQKLTEGNARFALGGTGMLLGETGETWGDLRFEIFLMCLLKVKSQKIGFRWMFVRFKKKRGVSGDQTRLWNLGDGDVNLGDISEIRDWDQPGYHAPGPTEVHFTSDILRWNMATHSQSQVKMCGKP